MLFGGACDVQPEKQLELAMSFIVYAKLVHYHTQASICVWGVLVPGSTCSSLISVAMTNTPTKPTQGSKVFIGTVKGGQGNSKQGP